MKKILIIDDDSLVRHAYALTFEDLNYDVDVVESGELGLEKINSDKYGLIFLDLNMPGMDGVETLRELRKLDENVPVYIVSGFHSAFLDELRKIKEDGIHFELARKPLNRDQLKEIVENVMNPGSNPPEDMTGE